MEHLNEAFSIYDKMFPENARQLLQPYSTLANLLLALNEYDDSIKEIYFEFSVFRFAIEIYADTDPRN